jgi:hypothetical protein
VSSLILYLPELSLLVARRTLVERVHVIAGLLIVAAGRIPPGRPLDSPPAHHGPTTREGGAMTGAKAQVGTGAPPGT